MTRTGFHSRHRLTAAGIIIGMLAATLAFSVSHDVGVAVAWGAAAGALVAGADPRLSLAAAVFFLVACPFYLLFHAQLKAQHIAFTAFYFLALGVGLELRGDLKKRNRSDDTRR